MSNNVCLISKSLGMSVVKYKTFQEIIGTYLQKKYGNKCAHLMSYSFRNYVIANKDVANHEMLMTRSEQN